MWHGSSGLEIEAEIVGADVELESLRRRIAAGLLCGLSVGFIADRHLDVWSAPTSARGLPTCRAAVRRSEKHRS